MTRGLSDAGLNRLWGAVCAFLGIFLLLWALSWVDAAVLREDLQNRCEELHTARFPFEKSCTRPDGTVEGAHTGALFDVIFFGSLTAGTVGLGSALVIEVGRRKSP